MEQSPELDPARKTRDEYTQNIADAYNLRWLDVLKESYPLIEHVAALYHELYQVDCNPEIFSRYGFWCLSEFQDSLLAEREEAKQLYSTICHKGGGLITRKS